MSVAPPFLSVITRTQGRRPHTLAATIGSLAAQTDQDFELLLIAHRVDEAALPELAAMLQSLPPGPRARARLMTVAHGTRAAPLNAGLDAAAGDYIAVLDDDDLALPNWVAVFRQLSESAPGRMLRAGNLQQNCREVLQDGVARVQACGPPAPVFPGHFDFFEHLSANRTAPVMLAFPRARLLSLELRFDESLTTTEDWDFIMRCAGPLGCADTAEVSSIYRYWETGECSRTVHQEAEWQANFAALTAKWDAAPFTLPAGSLAALRQMAAASAELPGLRAEHAAFRLALLRLARGGAPLPFADRLLDPNADATALRRDILAILDSRSWRLSAPLRRFRRLDRDALATLPAARLAEILAGLRTSFSWRITAPIRWRYAAPSAAGKAGP